MVPHYDEVPAGRGAVDLKRKQSQKFNLYPTSMNSPTSNNSPIDGPANGANGRRMQLTPAMNGHGHGLPPSRPQTAQSQHSQHSQYSQHSYHSGADDSYRPFTPQKLQTHTLRKQYSEASRLRALNIGYASPANGRHTPDRGRQTPDRPYPAVENFSRPRKPSVGQTNAPPQALLQVSTFPLAAKNENKLNSSHGTQAPRDRGFSTSSSQSNMTHSPAVQAPPTLKSSSSIPDYHSAGAAYVRPRNVNNFHYQPERGPSRVEGARPGSGHSTNRQERKQEPLSDEEARTSYRSAVTTTNSSYVASGTERSSVATRSSSVTSFSPVEAEVEEEDEQYGDDDDDGMSVDDAIGMYEDGFHDSGPEDNLDESQEDTLREDYQDTLKANQGDTSDNRPRTADMGTESRDSVKRRSFKLAQAMNDSLAPLQATVVRDSLAFFSGNMDHFNRPPVQHTQTGLSALSATSGRSMTRSMASSFDGNDEAPRELSVTESLSISGKNPKIRPPFGADRDRYGFKKASIHVSLEQYDSWNGPYTEYLIRRRKKWIALMQESKLMTDKPIRFPPKSAKVKRFVRKGIPPDWRGAAWFYYAGGPAELAKNDGLYKQLLEMRVKGALNETDEELIERDLHRTFPDNIKFKPFPDGPGENGDRDSQRSVNEPDTPTLQALRRVLQAFSILNPKIGYCQSLNFLAGLLLLFMEEERAFWMLNIITRHLPGTHEVNLEGANVDLGVLMSSIKESMPGIWAKINGDLDGEKASKSGGVGMRLPPITLCTTAWFMSCFIGTLPIETTLRVWDSFFYEGSKTLFRIALAIFKTGEQEIKAVSDPMEIFQVVQTIPRRLVDANALIEMTFERWNGFRHLSQEEIEKRRQERRDGYAEERRIAAGGVASAQRKGFLGRRKKTGLVL